MRGVKRVLTPVQKPPAARSLKATRPILFMPPKLRIATAQDLEAICKLQCASWRHAYRGMVPERFLTQDLDAVLGARWAALPGPGWTVLTAWASTRLVGFVAVDPARGGGAYVDNLHVAPDAHRQGVGRALMAQAAMHHVAAPKLWLTVIEANSPARGFYRRMGGIEGPAMTESLYGHTVVTRPVIWTDLAALAKL